MGVFAALALGLPIIKARVARAVFLGLFCATAWQSVRRKPVPPERDVRPNRKLLAVFVCCCLFSLQATVATAQRGAADAISHAPQLESQTDIAEQPRLHRIFIPVNSEGHVASTKHYIGESFLKELLLRVNQRETLGGDWLATSTEYQCELAAWLRSFFSPSRLIEHYD